ncbi:MAG: hypothetical protein D6730_10245 [Bacteroidetes bacterium]|nr:MAG: hypothetical protein D6730_10245 [Bacteroidota bacterium]
MTAERKKVLITLFAPLSLLLIPLIAMQFTSEVNWSARDFVVGGVLLLACSLTIAFARSSRFSQRSRTLIIVAAILILLLLWVELAVGIFNTPFAGS